MCVYDDVCVCVCWERERERDVGWGKFLNTKEEGGYQEHKYDAYSWLNDQSF